MGYRPLASLAVCLAVISFAIAPATANEIQTGGATNGLRIHTPEETLTDFCARDTDGRLWFAAPGGARYELITSTADPGISNPGDGAFHSFEQREVRAALAALRFPLGSISADVFLLPYPRRGGLESAAGAGVILLAPGVRPLSAEQQHAEFVHELGHVVHRALMPDANTAAWSGYRVLRGIENTVVYSAGATHANRPHEIFAEDFRALFGDPLANYSGTIENATIDEPHRVTGLEAYLLSLAGPPAAVVSLAASPNPSRGEVTFVRPGSEVATLDVFDALGRRIASLQPALSAGGVRWTWSGPGTGVFYARPRGDQSPGIRVTRLP